MIRFTSLCIGVTMATLASAELYTSPIYRDIRWLGRGNTGVALISDGTAAFYNPAGLGKEGVYNISLLNPVVGANRDAYEGASLLLKSSPQTIADYLDPVMGKAMSAQAAYFPYIRVPHFMVGYFIANSEVLLLRNPVNPELNIDYRYDRGVIIGGAYDILPNLHLGASLRFQRRSMIRDVLGGSIITDLSLDSLLQKLTVGQGFGLNMGLQYKHEITADQALHFGFSVADVGRTRFYARNIENGDPLMQEAYIAAGMAYTGQLPGVSYALLFDVTDLGQLSESYSKKLQVGAEVSIPAFTFRGGMYQGYWSAGLSASILPFMSIDLTTYAEELGVSGGQRSNRYYMLGLQLGMELNQKKQRKQKYTLDHL